MSKNRFYPRPPYNPTAAAIFWPTLSHFSTDLFLKRCQIDQEHILHQIGLSPNVFETSPFLAPLKPTTNNMSRGMFVMMLN